MKKKNGVLLKVTDADLKLLSKNPEKFWKGVRFIGSNAFENCQQEFEIEVPENVSLNNKAFSFSPVKKVVFKNPELEIGKYAFNYCKSLQEVVLPKTVKLINEFAFADCANLKSIQLPSTMKVIEEHVFYNCGLEQITLPEMLNQIKCGAFFGCKNLKQVQFKTQNQKQEFALKNGLEFSEGIKLENDCFKNCVNLEELENLSSVNYVGIDCFKMCESLKSADLSQVTFINENAFYSCKSLTEVQFSKKLKQIGSFAFAESNIESVNISGELERIENNAFDTCTNLKTVNISKLENSFTFSNEVFRLCSNLESVIIPNKATSLSKSLFFICKKLKTVEFEEGSNLKLIEEDCFNCCFNIEKIINMPTNLYNIQENAFEDSHKLDYFEISPTCNIEKGGALKYICKIGDKFFTSNKIISNDYVEVRGSGFANFFLRNWNDMQFRENYEKIGLKNFEKINLAQERLNTAYNCTIFDFLNNWNNSNLQKIIKNIDYVNSLIFIPKEHLNQSKSFVEFINLLNFDWFDKFIATLKKKFDNMYALGSFDKEFLSVLFYNLGGFQNLTYETKSASGKVTQISYDQKISEFLTFILTNRNITVEDLVDAFKDMKIYGFKKEFTDFLISKKDKHTYIFDEMWKAEKEVTGFISRSYNNFEEIQESNTSNKGSQRQLKPTVEHFYNYALRQLIGVNEHNQHIAKVVLKYFAADDSQRAFNNARIINANKMGYELKNNLSLIKMYEVLAAIESGNLKEIKKHKKYINFKEKIKDNILSSPLNEDIYLNKLSKLDSNLNKCENFCFNSVNSAVNTAENFTFEWLNKADPLNFVLGKLCNCCAHLEGMGAGIMSASIIHPSVQNLVIRNNKGTIIAKSTLYVNKEQGYAVFNNVEVCNFNIYENDEEEIYEKFMLGARAFMEQYNQENKKPLKIITVGMGRNDLTSVILKYNKKSKVYKPINYGSYDLDGKGYAGDSFDNQYVVYKSDELER